MTENDFNNLMRLLESIKADVAAIRSQTSPRIPGIPVTSYDPDVLRARGIFDLPSKPELETLADELVKEMGSAYPNALRRKSVTTWDGQLADAEIHENEYCPNCHLHKSLSIQYVDTQKSLAEATCLKCGRSKSVNVRIKYRTE